ncbi:MAG: putative zinc-binding protein [bacterium]
MNNSKDCGCACTSAPKLIFACSGASDTGELTDRAARKLSQDGAGKMFCLAGIGGRVSGIVASTQAAPKLLAIDGCPLLCAKKTLKEAGFTEFEHLCLTDLGLLKGNSPVSDELIAKVAEKGKTLLAG